MIPHVLGRDVQDTVTAAYGYHDVTVQRSLVYATRSASPQTVDVYDSSTWRRLRAIPTPCCAAENYSCHTLHVSDDRILLCCYFKHKLYELSHSGELLRTHGRSRDEATEDGIIGQTAAVEPVCNPGILSGPLLCQMDVEGSALVTDWGNRKLKLMRADGTWSVVDLDQTVRKPVAAVWCNASLYVANDDKIVRFSQKS